MKPGFEQHVMVSESSAAGRRSTRLPISVPIVISGKDARQNEFRETTRTIVVNKHGAKIVAAHQLAVGTEILIENRPLGAAARANVVWFNPEQGADHLHEAGVQLVDAENIWGIEFPPKDWGADPVDLGLAMPKAVPAPAPSPALPQPLPKGMAPAAATIAEKAPPQVSRPPGELTDAQFRTFQAKVEQFAEQIRTELETELRKKAASVRDEEAGTLDGVLEASQKQVQAVKAELERLEAKLLELQRGQQAVLESALPTLAPALLEERIVAQADPLIRKIIEDGSAAAREQFRAQIHTEADQALASWKDRVKTTWDSLSEMARQQMTGAVNSVVASMNRETETGLRQLKGYVQQEIQKQTEEGLQATKTQIHETTENHLELLIAQLRDVARATSDQEANRLRTQFDSLFANRLDQAQREALGVFSRKLQEMQERAVNDAAEAFRVRFSEILALLQPGGRK